VQALLTGEQVTDTLTVRVSDATGQFSTHAVTITVSGENDAPLVTADPAQLAGHVDEDGSAAATGTASASSPDHGAVLTWATVKADGKGDHGYLSVTPAGAWSYSVDPSDSLVQALTAGQTLTDLVDLVVTDDKGMSTRQTVTITIDGANDAPVVSGTAGAVVQEDGVLVVAGQLGASSVDAGAILSWSADAASVGQYGGFSLDATGNWTYTLDNSLPAVQALATGESLTDQITVTVSDQNGASSSTALSVQILGLDEAAVTPPPPPPAGGGYSAPPPPMGGGGTPPPNNLVLAILGLLCCWPLGIPAVVFAAQVNGKWASGDHAGAVDASAKAKKFGMIALILGIVVTVLYVILMMMGVVASSSTSSSM
jgi:VCBS repeat-containing protein